MKKKYPQWWEGRGKRRGGQQQRGRREQREGRERQRRGCRGGRPRGKGGLQEAQEEAALAGEGQSEGQEEEAQEGTDGGFLFCPFFYHLLPFIFNTPYMPKPNTIDDAKL